MIDQSTIFDVSIRLQRESSFCRTGHFDPFELAKNFSDEDAIEAWINFYGASPVAFEFGHWPRNIPTMVHVYGRKLVPYCENRIKNPLHGGGTAYGEEYLERCKRLQQRFCREVLETLEDYERALDD